MPWRTIAAGMAAGMAALGLAVTVRATPAQASASVGSFASVPRSAPARPASARPTLLQAFVLSSAPDSLADLQAHAQAIGVVYPTDFDCELSTGRITGEDTGAITAYARARHIAVMPRFNCQDGRVVHLILADPHVRARTLAGLVHIARNSAYAGLNLDLENDLAVDRTALTSFVTALAGKLHGLGKKLTVEVVGVTHDNSAIATGFYDDRALAAAADYVFVIAWGTHWEGSAAGPIAPLSFVAAVARYVTSLPHGGRFVLGAPMYGLNWPVPVGSTRPPRATALQYANVFALARSIGAIPFRDRFVDEMTFTYTHDGVAHRVWYMDAGAIADRLRIGRAHGLAVGVWRLGGEDQSLWSSRAVVEGLTGAGDPAASAGAG